MTIDRNRWVIKVNRNFLDSTGYKENEVLGHFCCEITHNLEEPCETAEGPCPFQEVLSTGKTSRVIHRHLDKEGRDIMVGR